MVHDEYEATRRNRANMPLIDFGISAAAAIYWRWLSSELSGRRE